MPASNGERELLGSGRQECFAAEIEIDRAILCGIGILRCALIGILHLELEHPARIVLFGSDVDAIRAPVCYFGVRQIASRDSVSIRAYGVIMRNHQPVTPRPARTAADRRAILEEYESYPRGDARRGATLRRHGVYTAHIATWRQRLARGETTCEHTSPGPKRQPHNPLQDERAQLRRDNARLQAQLAHAQAIRDVQKKSHRC